MKPILISLVYFYRWGLCPFARFFLGSSGACRYSPTCSCYALEALNRHGALHGSLLTAKRLLRCHPWGSVGYDPVPPLVSSVSDFNLAPDLATNSPGAGLGIRSGAGAEPKRQGQSPT